MVEDKPERYGVHPNLIGMWKKQAVEGLPQIFENGREARRHATEAEKDDLYRQIGVLQVELEFMKKSRGCWLSIRRQCELPDVARSSYYYQLQPESEENLRLMRRLDELYMEYPYYGSRKMAAAVAREWSQAINRKRVQRLMRRMGLEALYPKPNLSRPAPGGTRFSRIY
jgi:putative transposase